MNISVPITQLPSADGLSDADLFAVVQSGGTKKLSFLALSTALGTGPAVTIPTSVSVVSVSGSDELTIPALSVLTIIVVTGGAGSVKIGTSVGGGEIMDQTIESGDTYLIDQAVGLFFSLNTPIYFTGNFTARMAFIKFPS